MEIEFDIPTSKAIDFELERSNLSHSFQLDPTLTDSTKAAPADVVGSIKDAIDFQNETVNALKTDVATLANMETQEKTTRINDFELGRRSTSSTSQRSASMTGIIKTGVDVYYDNRKFKISIVYCDEAGNLKRSDGWVTTVPVQLEQRYTHAWLEVQYASGTSNISAVDINILNETTYYVEVSNSKLLETVKAVKMATIDTMYVAPDGDDGNDGLSRERPLATIQQAIDAGAGMILCKEGVYRTQVVLDGKHDVTICLDRSYDNYAPVTDESEPKIVIDCTNGPTKGIIIRDSSNCRIANVEVKNAKYMGFEIIRCSGLRIDDCIAHDIATSEPIGGEGGFVITYTDADFYNCVAYNICTTTKGQQRVRSDGFNIHKTGATNFINCQAWNCEDDGISHHDACIGTVIGGEWYNCGKAGVATPTHGAKVNVSNVYCHNNSVGIYLGNDDAVTDRGNIILTNCVCKGNDTYDIIVEDYYKVIAIGCKWDAVRGESNITAY